MALEHDSQALRAKDLAMIAVAMVLVGLALSIPTAMALEVQLVSS